MASTYRLFTTETTDGGYNVTDGVAVTGTGTYYSNLMSLDNATGISIEMRWTGTPAGTITMWKSNKPNPVLSTDADWIQLTDTFVDPAGTASSTDDELGNFRAHLMRIKYVNATGSGSFFGYAHVSRTA